MSDKTGAEVQACPFCDGKPASRWHGAAVPGMEDCGYWGIDCCIAHAHADDEEAAIRSWNTRAAQPVADQQVTVSGHKFLVTQLPDNFFDESPASKPVAAPAVPGWRPIEDAPFWDPAMGKQIPGCITYSKDYGVRTGKAWRWIGTNDFGANIDWVSGPCADIVTHWMPLPAAPLQADPLAGAGKPIAGAEGGDQ